MLLNWVASIDERMLFWQPAFEFFFALFIYKFVLDLAKNIVVVFVGSLTHARNA